MAVRKLDTGMFLQRFAIKVNLTECFRYVGKILPNTVSLVYCYLIE